MIHSMCGGKLKENRSATFAKVEFFDREKGFGWFLVEDIKVNIGDSVIVPVGFLREEGKVVEVVECNNHVTPIPIRTAKCIIGVKNE